MLLVDSTRIKDFVARYKNRQILPNVWWIEFFFKQFLSDKQLSKVNRDGTIETDGQKYSSQKK